MSQILGVSTAYASHRAPALVTRPLNVAVISDFKEECWPSMDLTADMLYECLAQNHPEEVAATQVRPQFRRRLLRTPLFGQKMAWNADRLINRFVDYPTWAARHSEAFDVYHVMDHSYSQLVHYLPAERTVVSCHDLDTFGCVLNRTRWPRPAWFRAMTRRILDGFRKAAHVICNSQCTRESLLSYDLFPPERTTVIHCGVHPEFAPLPHADGDLKAARFLGPLSSDSVVLLSVGSAIRRKRLDVLLRVFAGVRREFPKAILVRVGGEFTAEQLRLVRELELGKSILVLPFVGRDVLASVYRRASVLLQTSEAEGFCIPVAEAMACGCPVVASDLPVLREVGGSACRFCPTGDIETWRQKVSETLHTALVGGEQLASVRRNGLAQAAQFSWLENARRTVQVYQQIGG